MTQAGHSAKESFLNSLHDGQRKLAVNLLLVQLAICIGYCIYLVLFSGPFTRYFLPSLLVATLITLFLWMRKKYQSAIIFDLVALNIMLFLLSERMSVFTGVDLYYIAVGTATLALFGYEYWKAGVGFAIFSLALFLASRVFTFDTLPIRRFTPQQEEVFFVINSIIISGISIYCVITVMRINYQAHKRLQNVQTTIEEQNFELKKTNEELDRFVYSASHDLRSPLSSIKGLVNVFEMDKEGSKTEYLSKIKSRIETMDKFIREITDYSRNSRMQVSMEFILLNGLIGEVISAIQYTDNADKIDFHVEVPDDFVVRSDLYRLKIVMNNLISNAVKYSDLKKENPFVNIKASRDDGKVFIHVTDNGIGIKEELHSKIFNMFFRATEKSTGSGLGLYIVGESVKKLNGKIEVDSKPGLGSTFTLVLPQQNQTT